MSDTISVSCAHVFISQWVARFGVSQDISSDRGPQFTSPLWISVSQLLGVQLHHTTPYHPQSNGLVERFHRHLKAALPPRLTGPSWVKELPWVLLGIRTTPKEELGCSSAKTVYSTPLTVPRDFLASLANTHDDTALCLRQLRDQVRSLIAIPTSCHGTVFSSVPQNLQQAKFVFIRRDAHRKPLLHSNTAEFENLPGGCWREE